MEQLSFVGSFLILAGSNAIERGQCLPLGVIFFFIVVVDNILFTAFNRACSFGEFAFAAISSQDGLLAKTRVRGKFFRIAKEA